MKLPIHERFFIGSGKGGQHRNKTETCVEAWVILPDGTRIAATASSERSQYANRKIARRILKARVQQHLDLMSVSERYGAGHERVRTYHQSNNRVTDHASGLKLPWTEVMENDKGFAEMIEARRRAVNERN